MTPYARYHYPVGLAVACVVALLIKAVLESLGFLLAVAALLGTLASFGLVVAAVWAIIVLLLHVAGRY